jgi:transcriptional regulator of heat shock response
MEVGMSYFEKGLIGDKDDKAESAKVQNSKLNVRGKDIEDLLEEAIRTLKITNMQLSIITGEKFTEEDIED